MQFLGSMSAESFALHMRAGIATGRQSGVNSLNNKGTLLLLLQLHKFHAEARRLPYLAKRRRV